MKPFESTCIEPAPDFEHFDRVVRREAEAERVVFYELFSNIEAAVLGGSLDTSGLAPADAYRAQLDLHVRHQYALGYDYVAWRTPTFAFKRPERPVGETREGDRAYVTGEASLVSTRAEFDAYPWPDMAGVEFESLDWLAENTPCGMGIQACYSGVFENALWIMGYVPFCVSLHDDPGLVRDCIDAVGSRILAYYERACAHPAVRMIVMGEDMGFKTQTMVPPDVLREFVLPWHRKIVDCARENGVLTILHSCGCLTEIMGDIIETGWDAKHSFEDVIEPVWVAKEKYGDRIALLGGFDMDRLTRSTPEEVRRHTRFLIDNCTAAGGWALGSGNSIASYVPVQNYLAMMDEGWSYGGRLG